RPPSTLGRSVSSWIARRTPDELVALLGTILACATGTAVLARRRPGARLLARATVVASCLALVGIALRSTASPTQSGVILERAAVLHSAPHATRTSADSVRPGVEVRVLAESDHWVEIETEGRRGWIRRTRIGLLE
ncbi:MAG: hypothetical protein KDB80_08105, partial [Planctomycetes bacterium]|nr:hypothetical protein [Planctomycetota bacterium]